MDSTKNRLFKLIKHLGLKQTDFAELTGVDNAIICRILKGDNEPSVSVLRKIADATKVSPSWLIGYGKDDVIERM